VKRIGLAAISILLLGLTVFLFIKQYQSEYDYKSLQLNQNIVERTFANYHHKLEHLAIKHSLPENYLLALIALESSGRKIIPHRFESHVHEKLLDVKSGKLKNLERVVSSDLKNMGKDELKELASSWGPFQIMGYKCFEIGVSLNQLKGKSNLDHSLSWIKSNYGLFLKQEKFKDAFHYHNTGRKHPRIGPPRTYDKDYIPKGMKYMDEFTILLAEKS